MKKVTLKKLEIENFRGVKSLSIDFNDNETTISGANNTGKSTIMNAFMWCLFGKDSQDRKDFNIKRLVDGKTIDKTDATVTAILLVSGELIVLKRSFVENWAKPRGQAEEVFKGNETVVSFNDVPLSVTEYQTKVNDIIDDTVFKMLTNPSYFANMKWEQQREQLFRMAGAISDNEIAASKPEYADLLNQISGKTLADYKREVAAKKRKAKEQLDDIQPRIDQTNKLMPEEKDFEAIEKQMEDLKVKVATIDEALSNAAKAAELQNKAIADKINEMNGLKRDAEKIVFDAETAERERVNKEDSARRELIKGKDLYENEKRYAISEIEQINRNIATFERQEAGAKSLVEQYRKDWYAENSKEYKGELTCPVCGQKLPNSMIEEAENRFSEEKQCKLAEISENGKGQANSLEVITKNLTAEKELLKNKMDDLGKLEMQIQDLANQINGKPLLQPKNIIPSDIKEWVDLQDKIRGISIDIEGLSNGGSDNSELLARKSELQGIINELQAQLHDKSLIANYKSEIESLTAQGNQLAQQIADLERTEFTIKGFTKTKIEESEKRINSLFSLVTFRLFDYTQNGDEFETCIPLVHGVPFAVANTAGQINAGLDIINALTNYYGISAPIMIDNREGVNDIINTNSQIINLKVTTEPQLTIR